jgi:uncharacterized repeat protein (TIGR02543 family)
MPRLHTNLRYMPHFLVVILGALAVFGFIAAVLSPIKANGPAQASSSPWSSDHIYGCLDQPIVPFKLIPDSKPGEADYKLEEGRLPEGLELDSKEGVIWGTPKQQYSDKFAISSTYDDQNYPKNTFSALIDEQCRPTVEDIRPTSGPNSGGTELSITGSGFQQGATVEVDDAGTPLYLRDLRVESTRIIGLMPEYSGTGAVTLIIRNPDGSRYFATAAFQYDAAPIVHTVSFDGNGATGGSMAPEASSVSTPLTLNAFTRTGYTFNGWSTNPGGGGTTFSNGATYDFSADITLYAQWAIVPPTPTISMFDPAGTSQITTLNTVHFAHHSDDGFGENALIALTGFGANPPQTGYAIIANFPYYSDGSFNSVNDPMTSCQNGTPVTITSTTPSWAPTPPDGVIYRGITVQTGTYQSDVPWNCIAPGNYQMRLHVYDSQGRSAYFNFSIAEAPGTPTKFLQPVVDGVPSFGDFTVGQPMADDPESPTPGRGIRTDGDKGVFTISASPLIPDLAINVSSGGKGGGGDPYVVGTPTASGPYSFTITSTVAGANPTSYSHLFTGFVRYSTAQTVTFNGNGATSGHMDPQVADLKTPLSINAFARAGYSFNGWSTNASGGGDLFTDSGTYEFAADATLYAQWVEIPPVAHTVTFNGNGSTGGAMTAQTSAGAMILTANGFARTGYVFDEWNTAADGSGSTYDDATAYSFAQDLTLYAMWKLPNPTGGDNGVYHTVTYNGNGATGGSTAPQTSNVPAALRSNGFVRPGYVFHDWNSSTNHLGIELDAGDIYNFGADITFYAEWDKIPPAAVTISVEKPLIIDLLVGESKTLLVNVADNNGVLVPVTVDIPSGIIGVDGRVRITPRVSSASFAAGVISIQVEILDIFGSVIPQLLAPITIHFTTPLGTNIVAKSDDGLVWTAIPLLAGTTLPSGQSDGYYLDADGRVVIISSHLTLFGFKKYQTTAHSSSSPVTTLAVRASTRLVTSGGSGLGVVTFKSMTPTVCSVSSTGVVTAVRPGSCSVVTTKSGDTTYMHSSAKAIKITVTSISIDASATKVLISLGPSYAGKLVGIEISAKSNGFYRVVGQLKLSSAGSATLSRAIAVGTTVRVRIGAKTLASAKFTGQK